MAGFTASALDLRLTDWMENSSVKLGWESPRKELLP